MRPTCATDGGLIKLAEIFDITVDYLLTDRTEERPLHNLRLLERFRALEDFEAEDQEALIKLIDAMIVKNKVEGAITPFQKMQAKLLKKDTLCPPYLGPALIGYIFTVTNPTSRPMFTLTATMIHVNSGSIRLPWPAI